MTKVLTGKRDLTGPLRGPGIAEEKESSRCQLFIYVDQIGGTLASTVSISMLVTPGINSYKASIPHAFARDTHYSQEKRTRGYCFQCVATRKRLSCH